MSKFIAWPIPLSPVHEEAQRITAVWLYNLSYKPLTPKHDCQS